MPRASRLSVTMPEQPLTCGYYDRETFVHHARTAIQRVLDGTAECVTLKPPWETQLPLINTVSDYCQVSYDSTHGTGELLVQTWQPIFRERTYGGCVLTSKLTDAVEVHAKLCSWQSGSGPGLGYRFMRISKPSVSKQFRLVRYQLVDVPGWSEDVVKVGMYRQGPDDPCARGRVLASP